MMTIFSQTTASAGRKVAESNICQDMNSMKPQYASRVFLGAKVCKGGMKAWKPVDKRKTTAWLVTYSVYKDYI